MGQAYKEELKLRRQAIDAADAQIVQALARRYQATDALGRLKAEQGVAVYDPDREELLYASLRQQAIAAGLPPDLTDRLWQTIIEYSRKRQHETSA